MNIQRRPREGFIHNGLILYAAQYELASTPASWLIVWLDAEGNSLKPWVQPAGLARRMAAVKPGDEVLHQGQRHTISGVSIYLALGTEPGREVVG